MKTIEVLIIEPRDVEASGAFTPEAHEAVQSAEHVVHCRTIVKSRLDWLGVAGSTIVWSGESGVSTFPPAPRGFSEPTVPEPPSTLWSQDDLLLSAMHAMQGAHRANVRADFAEHLSKRVMLRSGEATRPPETVQVAVPHAPLVSTAAVLPADHTHKARISYILRMHGPSRGRDIRDMLAGSGLNYTLTAIRTALSCGKREGWLKRGKGCRWHLVDPEPASA